MILTDDELLAKNCRESRNLCFIPNKRFVHEKFGWNFRMTNLQAALGVAQLERLDEFLEKKRWIGKKYNELLADISGIQLPLTKTNYAKNIYWVVAILITNKNINLDAKKVTQKLNELGIGTRPFFWPMHEQDILKKMKIFCLWIQF